MIDLTYATEVKERAMMLGIEKGYLDSTEIFYFYNNQLCLNLDNYINNLDMTDLETDEDGYVIELPNIFYAILMDTGHEVYKNSRAFHIIFPSDVMYVGHLTGISSNIIRITGVGAAKKGTYRNAFMNSCLDFSACRRLNTIPGFAFLGLTVKKLLFGVGINWILPNGFQGCHIGKVCFENLTSLHSHSFYHTQVEEVDFGNHLTSVEALAFDFDSMVEEVKIAGIGQITLPNFANVKNLYLPYSVYGDVEEIADKLDDIQKMIRYKKPGEAKVIKEIQNILDKYELEKEKKGVLKRIEGLIYEYYFGDDTSDKSKKKIGDYIALDCVEKIFRKITKDTSIYFYCDTYFISQYDVHDREYDEITTINLGPDKSLHLYIEEPDY